MSPQDQQLEVEVSITSICLASLGCVAWAPSPVACTIKALRGFNQPTGEAKPEEALSGARKAMPLLAFAGAGPFGLAQGRPAPHNHANHTPYPENEVPHPHDFDALGLTNTNPCCIRVS